ncbi:M1 family aminopeptidase [Aureispira anguillae]|uniref:Aminopeptidase N n=1 Tax=Aureispira anguillae TaxID=2864201 RepID=A0A915YGY1_9BACT|nr:M1 family aminopeptidase [Aureispira anguillae]BDS12840.1 hypothetical protein AsAng_0035650 [Aureispira anguillae]
MRGTLILWIGVLLIANPLWAQEDCLNDPSCQHTKSMLLEANRQWGNQSSGINTNKRCDSLDILHYTVALDMTNHEGAFVMGSCEIHFRAKKDGVDELPLDLLRMEVDSVLMDTQPLSYHYNDTLLTLQLAHPLTNGEEKRVTIYYKGNPQEDETWGGFYYKGDYAYNMGVGFAADPHNYGRVWHPCFDNFRERATYTFHIKTKSDQRAHCNGYLQAENTLNGFTTRTWQQKDPIPTYLACIAVGNYTTIKQSYDSPNGLVPIELVANAADTANLKQSFQHLNQAIAAYEYWYGPHRWSKVGYSLVPFRSGAMEHATNIAYPISAANGTLKREHLMVHELGHSWWGNLVTCATAKDMWINEGMASYSEDLFWEYTYGWNRYINDVKKNHYRVLGIAHQQEKGYRPIAGVPHEYTYGMHVYNKGASVVHNMRWYMGDTAFRKGLHYITKNYAFKNLTSAGFRDALTTATGIDMGAFFDDWVFRGGFPHFEVEEFTTVPEGNDYKVTLAVRQKLVGRTIYCKAVPLQLTFLDDNWNKHSAIIQVSDALDTATVLVPFLPTSIIVNEEHRLNQARYDEQLIVRAADSIKAKLQYREVGIDNLWIKEQSDSAWLHLEHHVVAPSTNKLPKGYTLSKQHYWTIDGVLPHDFDAEAIIAEHGKLDADLTQKVGVDSLVLLYRPNVNAAWQVHPNFIRSFFLGKTIFAFTLLKGDYALANGPVKPQYFEAQKKINFLQFDWSQTKHALRLNIGVTGIQKTCVELYNLKGERCYEKLVTLSKKAKYINIPTQGKASGVYFLKLRNSKGKLIKSKKIHLD